MFIEFKHHFYNLDLVYCFKIVDDTTIHLMFDKETSISLTRDTFASYEKLVRHLLDKVNDF